MSLTLAMITATRLLDCTVLGAVAFSIQHFGDPVWVSGANTFSRDFLGVDWSKVRTDIRCHLP